MSTQDNNGNDDDNGGNGSNGNEPSTASEIPAILLLDPDRVDLKDPLQLVINKENAMGITELGKSITPDTALPPLTEDGLSITEPLVPERTADKPYIPGREQRQTKRAAELLAWEHGERTARLMSKAARDQYIEDAGNTILDAQNNLDPTDSMILSNPLSYLDELDSLSSLSAHIGRNSIVTSLGYFIVAGLRAELRAARRPSAPEPSIDIFADNQADIDDSRAQHALSEELGYMALPPFDFRNLIGPYKWLLIEQRANIYWSAKYAPQMPHQVLHQMHTDDRSAEVAKANEAIEIQLVGADNPALPAILAKSRDLKRQRDAQQVIEFKQERAYVLETIQKAPVELFSDDLWDSIPLHIQFRFATMAYNQVVNAVSRILADRAPDLDKIKRLGVMAKTFYLELEGAGRKAEVKAAFAQGKLDDRHDIVVKLPKEAENAEPQPKMQRAPRPDDKVKPLDPHPHSNLDDDIRS